jgi:hypothetical protein
MPDNLPDNMKKVGSVPHHDLLIADAEDILIVLPEEGFKDTPDASRVTVAALHEYARTLSRKCGLVIMANNLLAQEPESRRIYAETIVPELFFGISMVVNNPISRIIGSMGLRLALRVRSLVEMSLVAWLETQRNREDYPSTDAHTVWRSDRSFEFLRINVSNGWYCHSMRK